MSRSFATRSIEALRAAVWEDERAGRFALPPGLALAARTVWVAARGFAGDACALRASALTLASMLALVPALAVSFAFVRGLGWSGERLEAMLLERATILSPDAVSIVVSWVDNISIAGLGLFGALFAATSAVSVLQQLESAFDAIWGNFAPRSGIRRAADAVAILTLGPLLLAVTASSEAALRSSSVVEWLASFGGAETMVRVGFGAMWYLLVCGAFAALYVFLPTAPVAPAAAALAGLFVGVAWLAAQSAYVAFQFGLDRYNAVYGTIAQIPALVAWMWTSWVLILAGAELAAAFHDLDVCRQSDSALRERPRADPAVALALAVELADASAKRRRAPTLDVLARSLRMPIRSVGAAFAALADAGLVHTGGTDSRSCFLSFSPGSIPVFDVLDAVESRASSAAPRPVAAAEALRAVDDARREALGASTLADLVERDQVRA